MVIRTTSSGGATSDKLLEVEVPVVSNTVCNAAMGVDVSWSLVVKKPVTFTD